MTTIKSLRSLAKKDATKNLQLEITKIDIRHAKPLDPENCAAACALKRQGFAEAVVMRSTTYVNKGSKASPDWVRYATPASLAREIVALDRGGRVEPGTFMMQPFSEQRKLGRKPWKQRTSSTSANKRLYRHVTAKIREA
jgi:hypothetical protein